MEVLSHEEEDSVIAGGSLGLSGGFWSGGERLGGVGILYVCWVAVEVVAPHVEEGRKQGG